MREADGEPMTLAALVCSYGPPAEWRPRAARAAASCQLAGFDVVIESHVNDMTLAEVRNATAEGVDADWMLDNLEFPGDVEKMQEFIGGAEPDGGDVPPTAAAGEPSST